MTDEEYLRAITSRAPELPDHVREAVEILQKVVDRDRNMSDSERQGLNRRRTKLEKTVYGKKP